VEQENDNQQFWDNISGFLGFDGQPYLRRHDTIL